MSKSKTLERIGNHYFFVSQMEPIDAAVFSVDSPSVFCPGKFKKIFTQLLVTMV